VTVRRFRSKYYPAEQLERSDARRPAGMPFPVPQAVADAFYGDRLLRTLTRLAGRATLLLGAVLRVLLGHSGDPVPVFWPLLQPIYRALQVRLRKRRPLQLRIFQQRPFQMRSIERCPF